jgi:hypothetical protein
MDAEEVEALQLSGQHQRQEEAVERLLRVIKRPSNDDT